MAKTVSLVLGSGGARGYAHISVIREIEKRDLEIKAISGSSMGALIGGLYACGKLDEFERWVLDVDFFELVKYLDFSFSKLGLIKGEKIFSKIEKMIGDVMIEDLDITYTAVATDFVNRKEIFLRQGKLIDAIRASVAIPTIFIPKEIKGKLLFDGGVLDPVPVAPIISEFSDLIIAVDVGSDETIPQKYRYILEEKKNNNFKSKFLNFFKTNENKSEIDYSFILLDMIEMMQNVIARHKLASYKPDIVINISVDVCKFYQFYKTKEIIEYGKVIAKEVLNKELEK